MSTKFVMPLSGANGNGATVTTVPAVAAVAAVPAERCYNKNDTLCLSNGTCPISVECYTNNDCQPKSSCIESTIPNYKTCGSSNCTSSSPAQPAQPAGFNITQITGPHNTPTEIQLREVTKCSIDAYAFQFPFSPPDADIIIVTPDSDGVVNRDPNSYSGCNTGTDWNNFGKIFSGKSGWSIFPSLATVIDDYTAIPSHNYTLHKNYCTIILNMKTGKSCDDIGFGNDYYHFKDGAGNQITSAVPAFSSIKVKCRNDTELITYPITNSIVTFDPTKSPPTIEFTPNNNEDLGCSYQHNGTNYVAFSCNDAGTSVEVVEYRCGL